MKKISFYLMMMMVVSLNVFPSIINPSEKKYGVVATKAKEMPAEVKVMFTRLEEIKNMDGSNINYSDKKALRKKVSTIKTDLRASSNGVYFSVGAIIIVILLLILIL